MKLIEVRARHHFDILALAHKARVPEEVVYHMLIDEPVMRSHAEAVLAALSKQCGSEYSLHNVEVKMRP